MARIIIFTYDTQIDRRALLQCKSLIAKGHEVTLYAPPYAHSAQDPDYVIRLDQLHHQAGQTLANPSIYMQAIALKQRLSASHPRLLHIILPVVRPLFWYLHNLLPDIYISLHPWSCRIHRRTIGTAFEKMFETVLALPLNADLFIAHDLPMLPVAAAAKKKYGGRLLYDSHELFPEQEFTEKERRRWRQLEASHISAADRVVTVNPSIAQLMESAYGLPRVEVIYNAEWLPDMPPETNNKYLHQQLGLPLQARILLYQGGLSQHRNLDGLVRAMAVLCDPTIHLVYLGSGPMLHSLQSLVLEIGLTANVHFIPAVPQAELLRYTAAASVGVIPYVETCLNTRYCTPNKLFEFVAAGLPIIGSDLTEVRRLLTNHDIGMVVDMRDPESLAAAIRDMFTPTNLERYRVNIRKARETLNWQHEGARFVAIVEQVLAA